MWSEWLRLTRLMWSARIAFENEIESSERLSPTDLVRFNDAGAEFEVSRADHVAVLTDLSLFYELVLLWSYALMENHCKLLHFICAYRDWSLIDRMPTTHEKAEIDAVELIGGIEGWSSRLMGQTRQPWNDVFGGKSGLVEISVIRNALIHGYTLVSGELVDSAGRRGCTIPFVAGQRIAIGFPLLHEYRGRIRSLCRVLSDGVVHMARGSHRDPGNTRA
jgi:hypothetical protein